MTPATATAGAVPPPPALPPLSLPPLAPPRPVPPLEAVDTVLPTGLRVVAARRATAPVVQLRLGVPFGGSTARHAAAAELLSCTLLAGGPGADRTAVDDALAAVGGSLKAVVGPEELLVTGQVLAEGLPRLLAVLADCLTGAGYEPTVLAAERERLLHRVRLTGSMPARAARAALLRHCFGDHPATRETPAEEQVADIGRDEVAALHRTALVPRGTVLLLVGDVRPDRAVAEAARLLGGWSSPHRAVRMDPLPAPAHPGEPALAVPSPGARQCEARLAAPSLVRTDPGYPALLLADQVFGGHFSSRLVQRLREREGLIYSGRSAIEQRTGSAIGTVQFASAPQHAAAAVDGTLDELAAVSGDRPPTDAEIAAARGYALGVQALVRSTQKGLADSLHGPLLAGLPLDWPDTVAERVRTVPDDEVRAAAAAHLRPAAYTAVLLGPPAPDRPLP
ncbi:M16 family metallopeptidase [Kitasatospora phosalacinea]|uniref:M16 family metallopeptidase n=1 Tax=Kitasatospora phosalacinea TaxID=2065 RepID=UPI003648CC82